MIQNLLNTIASSTAKWDWSEIVTGIVGIWMAVIATMALNTWKRQSKAKKQTDFLDELTDTVHKYINDISGPSEFVKYVKIGIESSQGLDHLLDKKLKNPKAIAYIKELGKDDSKRLDEYLEHCKSSISKIHALVAKGQVIGLKDYKKCQNSCRMLTWQYERIQGLSFMIGNPSVNWKNEDVQRTLTKVIALDHDNINKYIGENYTLFLTFVKDNYEKIFK